MATITTTSGGASAGRTAGSVPYLVDRFIDFAAAATSKGSALAAADVIECISVPVNTLILNAGIEITTVLGGESSDTTFDLGITGTDADVFVDGFDADAAAAGERRAVGAECQRHDVMRVRSQGVEAFSSRRRPQLDSVILIATAAGQLRAIRGPRHAHDPTTMSSESL